MSAYCDCREDGERKEGNIQKIPLKVHFLLKTGARIQRAKYIRRSRDKLNLKFHFTGMGSSILSSIYSYKHVNMQEVYVKFQVQQLWKENMEVIITRCLFSIYHGVSLFGVLHTGSLM